MRELPVQQGWVLRLPLMQQSVLIAAVRAPDGIRKDHPVKVLLRWYRRCCLLSAFDTRALLDPFEGGGGSFTGPFTHEHVAAFLRPDVTREEARRSWERGWNLNDKHRLLSDMRLVYLRHIDELPHHFQLHFMHAAQVVGFKHDVPWIRGWWSEFYQMIVNDAHLFPESEAQMDDRLGDFEPAWRAREEVIAR